MAGGVFAQVVEGSQADSGWRAGGCRGAGLEELAGAVDGGADCTAPGAEEGGDDVDGRVQVIADERGDQVVGQVEPAERAGAGGVDAAVAAEGVELLLAQGGGRELEGGGEGGELLAADAGEGGVAEGVPGAAAGAGRRFRFRLRGGAGDGEQDVVPVAVEGVPH